MSNNARHRSRRQAQFAAYFVTLVGATLLMTHEKPHPGAIDLPPLPTGDIAARKQAFFDFLRPIVVHHNDRIREERAFLMSLDIAEEPGWWQRRRFAELAVRYAVDRSALGHAEALTLLRRRVDVIPPSLVLIQAAKESGWGRSRFAREGNALFGEWCFSEGCGMVPKRRSAGRRHEVRSFDSVHDAVASYMDNINSHRGYRDLRVARAAMRDDGEKLSGLRLAEHLLRYSERGDVYVNEIRNMIIANGLESG